MNNRKTVEAIYAAFGRGDVAFILSCLDEAVVWEKWTDNHAQKAGVPYMKEQRGVDGVAEFFVAVDALGITAFEVVSIMDGGDKIAVEFNLRAERFGTEEEMHLWTFNEAGKVTGFRHYLDTAKHIAANESLPRSTAA